MSAPGGWERLCRLIDDDHELVDAVSSAPEGERWNVLIDGLDECGALAYLESEDFGSELADALAGLPRVLAAGPDLTEVVDIDDLAEAVASADSILAPHGLRIVYLAEDDDAFPLVVVALADAEAVVALAAALGHEARVF